MSEVIGSSALIPPAPIAEPVPEVVQPVAGSPVVTGGPDALASAIAAGSTSEPSLLARISHVLEQFEHGSVTAARDLLTKIHEDLSKL